MGTVEQFSMLHACMFTPVLCVSCRINELSVTLMVSGGWWHLLDAASYPEQMLPETFGKFLQYYAVAMRPQLMHHATARKPGENIGWVHRVRNALPSLGRALCEYAGCEAVNAWLMCQAKGVSICTGSVT